MIDLEPYLAYAVDLAVEAGRRTLEHYQTGVRVELKADQSPVTLADLAAERFIREGIARRFPHHAIAGE
jgi:histidinol-phosphatase